MNTGAKGPWVVYPELEYLVCFKDGTDFIVVAEVANWIEIEDRKAIAREIVDAHNSSIPEERDDRTN